MHVAVAQPRRGWGSCPESEASGVVLIRWQRRQVGGRGALRDGQLVLSGLRENWA